MTRTGLFLTGAAIVAALGISQPLQATTITFDQTITPGANATVDSEPGFIDQYQGPPQGFPGALNPDVFFTQGFDFGGYTPPVTLTRTSPELIIMLNTALCPAEIGTTCANDGSRYLLGDPFSMFIGAGATFSLAGFDATGMFPPAGCPQFIPDVQPGCDDQGVILPAAYIRVVGVNASNGVLASQISPLTSSFTSISLTDPAWGNIAKAIFIQVDAQGNPVDRMMAIDNIVATPTVPEPASLVLLATGLAGAGARRWRGRRRAE